MEDIVEVFYNNYVFLMSSASNGRQPGVNNTFHQSSGLEHSNPVYARPWFYNLILLLKFYILHEH